jgi:hypothetical protein
MSRDTYAPCPETRHCQGHPPHRTRLRRVLLRWQAPPTGEPCSPGSVVAGDPTAPTRKGCVPLALVADAIGPAQYPLGGVERACGPRRLRRQSQPDLLATQGGCSAAALQLPSGTSMVVRRRRVLTVAEDAGMPAQPVSSATMSTSALPGRAQPAPPPAPRATTARRLLRRR